jgi:hypothetical protein
MASRYKDDATLRGKKLRVYMQAKLGGKSEEREGLDWSKSAGQKCVCYYVAYLVPQV